MELLKSVSAAEVLGVSMKYFNIAVVEYTLLYPHTRTRVEQELVLAIYECINFFLYCLSRVLG